MSDRLTPLHGFDSPSSADVINLQISGNRVTRSGELGAASLKTRRTNIGNIGSLSHITDLKPTLDSQSVVGSCTSSATASPVSTSAQPWSPFSLHFKSESEAEIGTAAAASDVTVNSTATAALQLRNATSVPSAAAATVFVSSAEPSLLRAVNPVNRLHPLIDHDYGSFKEFNAEIQSSIIATTESKLKVEKYNQKAKAQRSREAFYKLDRNLKKRRYAAADLQRRTRYGRVASLSLVGGGDGTSPKMTFTNYDARSRSLLSKPSLRPLRRSAQAALERRTPTKVRTMPRRDSKDYVKITGSFQDDFIYYATKHTRGRTRKAPEPVVEGAPAPKTTKKPAVGGMSVFDWYQDLSKTDKTSRFGVPEPSTAQTNASVGDNDKSNQTSGSSGNKGGCTPVHDSDVADLVLSMLPTEELPTDLNAAPNGLSGISTDAISLQSESVVTSEADCNLQQEQIEQVLSKLMTTMGESALDMIAEKLKNDLPPALQNDVSDVTIKTEPDSGTIPILSPPLIDVKDEPKPDTKVDDVKAQEPTVSCDDTKSSSSDAATSVTAASSTEAAALAADSFNSLEASDIGAFLGPMAVSSSQTSSSFDLDDINDDLLPSSLCNMNAIIGDLARSSVASSIIDAKPLTSVSPIKLPRRAPAHAPILPLATDADLSESFASEGLAAIEVNRTPTNSPIQRPPELITVSMFWNDLPGLMIAGKRWVRLVDIHKQMLPCKDTGTSCSYFMH